MPKYQLALADTISAMPGIIWRASIVMAFGAITYSWWWAMGHGWEAEVFLPMRFGIWESGIEGGIFHAGLVYSVVSFGTHIKRTSKED